MRSTPLRSLLSSHPPDGAPTASLPERKRVGIAAKRNSCSYPPIATERVSARLIHEWSRSRPRSPAKCSASISKFFRPGLSVLVGTYAVSILAAKERTARTAEHAMEEPGKLRIDGLMVGISHAATLRLSQSHRYPPIPHERVNESWVTPICRPDLTEICLIHSRECAKCLN
jgi:hypothetical protein